jgi:hypothetical protein
MGVRSKGVLFRTGILAAILGALLAATAQAQATFTVNASQNVQAISPYIYGTNDSNLIPAATNVRLGAIAGRRTTGKTTIPMPAAITTFKTIMR